MEVTGLLILRCPDTVLRMAGNDASADGLLRTGPVVNRWVNRAFAGNCLWLLLGAMRQMLVRMEC
jgi:hypothetical protein